MSEQEKAPDENRLIAQRREKLAGYREAGQAYPNDFRRDTQAEELQLAYGQRSNESLETVTDEFALAGRMMAKRVMGKASFTQLQDSSGRIQVFVQRDAVGEETYKDFKTWDVGDIIGVRGSVMKTRTGELSVKAREIRLLSKSLRPLPEKWAGLTDTETRYRQRYVDLIMNPDVKRVFATRGAVIRFTRQFLDSIGYTEVETPMLQPIPGGAAARPFATHYNALDRDFYLRIAPELYLKRLVVGGFDKVYEINRNFRNEGLSTRHNPEFTMMELYEAYATYNEIMDLTEGVIRDVARTVNGGTEVEWDGAKIDLGPAFRRWRMDEAVRHHNPEISAADCTDREALLRHCERLKIRVKPSYGWGKLLLEIFEATVEHTLIQPTFITEYPIENSPLSRRNEVDDRYVDRFEIFVAGMELGNAFSELNDPADQRERFEHQVAQRDGGDNEAMFMDLDYVRALEYGMPPAAGEGVGVDRLVMLMTDTQTIREVILFPQMRPE